MDLSDIVHLQTSAPFLMPGRPSDKYLIPLSGGADSSALAILMHWMFPNHPFEYCFTDTVAEEPEIYTTLDTLEEYLGKPITRIVPEMGLFELIEHYKGFLPSSQARWCTRELKLRTFKTWIEQFKGQQKYMFVGIRSDESDRLAFTIDEVETVMPFIDLNLKREHIFAILEKTIGIPRYYRRRTRSGCSVCFFQRRSELVGLLQEACNEFNRGLKCEKLSPVDAARHQEATPLWKDSGIAANWLSLPLPEDGHKIQGRKPKASSLSLFGRGVFVGGEFFMDGLLSNDEFIWHQRVVSYSPTMHGIKRQLDDRYQHLLATGEVYGMTPDEVRSKVKFAIWYVELPEDVFDPDPPKDGGYTWQQGESYQQLRHVIQWVTRSLQAESMRQQAAATPRLLSVQYEWTEASKAGLAKLNEEVGSVSLSQWYQASEQPAELSVEEEVKRVPCPMCSI